MPRSASKTLPISRPRFLPTAQPDANALELFARVVAAGSFAEAARRLGQTRAAVSRRMAVIEAQVGQPLLARTTRSLGLTEAGRRLAQRARAVLEASEAARAALRVSQAALAGRLRLTAVPSFGRAMLVPLLAEFRALHPAVGFELLFTDRRVDLLREGIDVAFRITRKPPEDWVATPLCALRIGAYAAPAWLGAQPAAPARPEDLADAPLLLLGAARESLRLHWRDTQGQTGTLALRAEALAFSEDLDSLLGLARAGAGVVLAPDYAAAADLQAQRLVELLPDWSLPIEEGDRVMALTLPQPLVSEAARALVRLAQSRWSPPA